MKLLMTKGLPGAGKTTLVKRMQEKNPNLVRVNKDSLRQMLHSGVWSRKNERQVINIRNFIIEDSLNYKKDVVVDDTGFGIHATTLMGIAEKYGADFEIIDFTSKDSKFYVPLETCIKQDLERANSVGTKVIMRMYNRFLKPKSKPLNPIIFDPSLPYCIIADLDGTIAFINDRSPYDGKSCASDLPNKSVIDLLITYNDSELNETKIIIFSGRNGDSRKETEKWLDDKNVPYYRLYMREEGDHRKDSVIKKEMFDKFIRDKYNLTFVVDDRKQVKKMWNELGATVLDVNQYDEEF